MEVFTLCNCSNITSSYGTHYKQKQIAVTIIKQESPPAWTQEAYRPPCSEYSFCCPTRVRYPPWGGVPGLRYPPRGGTRTSVPPPGGYPDFGTPRGGVPGLRYPLPRGGTRTSVPPRGGTWTPPGGVPGLRYPPGGVPGLRYPPRGGYPDFGTPRGGYPDPPPVDRQTPVKTVPSRRTTYAGGKNAQRELSFS